ncbi:MAG: homoserine O-acetyltransferase/O-succinyltransferase family protein, partial [Terriglobales bacterium]
MPVEFEYPPQSPGHGTDGAAPDAAAGLRIALVNNMPDSALVDTEEQFRDLLDAAAGGQSIRLTRHALPGVRRGPEAAARLAREYFGMEELLARRYDGVII